MNAPAKIEANTTVYAKIAAVQGELAKAGIGKDSVNSYDKYKFRGIDAVYNALAPLLAKHGLCVLPRIVERDLQERVSRKGDPVFYITVTAEFDFVSADDGSIHVVRTYGEAMDRGDKATNKAMSAAYKYAAFMTFAIPTEGDNDADASSHDIEPREGQSQGNDQGAVSSPANFAPPEEWAVRPKGAKPTKTDLDQIVREITHNLEGAGDEDSLTLYTQTDDYKEGKAALEQHRPSALFGPPPRHLPEYVPIRELIKRKIALFRMEAERQELTPLDAG